MTLVKICGLTRLRDAVHAEESGASMLGVILAGGPRRLSLEAAAQVIGAKRPAVKRAAVFGDGDADFFHDCAESLDLDILQLHGDPDVRLVETMRGRSNRALWPVLRVDGTDLPSESEALANAAGTLVFDAKVVGQLGGTGVALDWRGLRHAVDTLRTRVPGLQIVLAGGLRPSNVAQAMALLQPDVVDVSSGVESAPGVKDPKAVEQFVAAVQTAQRNS
ncbi:MAG: phosphoribosylanthranilate isomerase [Gemmatimonadaceae bacterium]|nr:phosphoribosylanthranilate isomerase [Gemmatimonadaceae bacterium]